MVCRVQSHAPAAEGYKPRAIGTAGRPPTRPAWGGGDVCETTYAMSRRVLNAHTGESLLTDTAASETFEGLKRWITERTGISDARQVLMTGRGKPVKLQTLRTEEDIFVYDRDLIQGSPDKLARSLTEKGYPTTYDPAPIPKGVAEGAEPEAWLSAVKERSIWAEDVCQACANMAEQGRRLSTEASIVQQATAIAVERLKQHISGLRQRHKQAQGWVEGLAADQTAFAQEQDALQDRLSAVPVVAALRTYMRGAGRAEGKTRTLFDLIGQDEFSSLAQKAKGVSGRLAGVLLDLSSASEGTFADGSKLISSFSADFTSSTGEFLETLDNHIEEQGVLCKKILDDCNSLARNGATDVLQCQKVFGKHERNLVTPLLEEVAGIQDILHALFDHKSRISGTAIEYLQRVSAVESSIGHITQLFSRLELEEADEDALDGLDAVYRVPMVYGSLLLEVARRREWTEKMTTDSTSLAEEMATYKDEEERRRKKWLKSIGQYLSDRVTSDAMRVDVSVRSTEEDWPTLTRADADKYIQALTKAGGFDDTAQELHSQLQSIDAPSKQQSKRANAFRKGSIHDAAFGRNSLLLRGDDDIIRNLQQEKQRLEDRLKGSDSRVRRLEDLLHRQSQVQSRPVSRDVTVPYSLDKQISTPGSADGSGFSKVPVHPQSVGVHDSRQSSLVAQIREQSPMAERVAQLEAELNAERAKTAKIQDSAARQMETEDSLRVQLQEAASTKNDLLGNFQAQQNEFDGERRLLESEARKLKVRIEELEEDFDRILGSHDNARLGLDERTKAFEQELRNHRERAAEELERIVTERDALKDEAFQAQSDLATVQRQVSDQEQATARAEERFRDLESAARTREETHKEHHRALRAAHLHLANNAPTPPEFDSLVDALEALSLKATQHQQDLQAALEKAKSELTWQEKQLTARDSEARKLKARFDQEELEVFSLREEIADRNARHSALEAEIEEQRQELESLRSRHVDGENTSKSLQDRLRDEEEKSRKLHGDAQGAISKHAELEDQLSRLTERLSITEKSRDEQQSQLDQRAKRAEEVSVKLWQQHSFLLRLLTQVGYTATQQNGTYTFERTSRLGNNSSVIEISPTATRTLSGDVPTSQETEPTPRHVQWAYSDNLASEEQSFKEYLTDIDALQIEGVVDTLVKRFKDVEHIARKWQREAKNYRERFHKSQFDGQNKIAYRSFKEGDLALFLPTRNQAPRRSWAAFNVGAPHYFLREQETHTLNSRDWLVARIAKVEERIVDLSKGPEPVSTPVKDGEGLAEAEEDNPFGLSDGLRWYYLDAAEERLGAAPSTPGLGKSTVASAPEHATGSSVQNKKKPGEAAAAKVLTKSLDSRRSSSNSKKSTAGALASPANATGTFDVGNAELNGAAAAVSAVAGDRGSIRKVASRESAQNEVRRDQLLG